MLSLGGALAVLSPSAKAGTGHDLPRRFLGAPFSLMSLTIGYPNDGFQLRAKKLKNSDFLKVKDGSKDNVFAHPALVLMLERSAREVARVEKGSLMVVGDLSRRDGGPLAGHVSHQSGRDADVGFYLRDAAGRPVVREHFTPFEPNGRSRWVGAHLRLERPALAADRIRAQRPALRALRRRRCAALEATSGSERARRPLSRAHCLSRQLGRTVPKRVASRRLSRPLHRRSADEVARARGELPSTTLFLDAPCEAAPLRERGPRPPSRITRRWSEPRCR